MKNIGIIGSGSFGCALANVLIKNHNVKIWSFKKEEANVINIKKIYQFTKSKSIGGWQ